MRPAVLLAACLGCAHVTELELEPRWTAPAGTRFFLIGSVVADKPAPALLAQVLASTRGGLAELGFSARTGFASASEAQAAMKAASCDVRCVLVELHITDHSNGRGMSQHILGRGALSLELELGFIDVNGQRIAGGEVIAESFDDDHMPSLERHVVTRIGPVIGAAVAERR